jgi:type I restriction enzyme S subunit
MAGEWRETTLDQLGRIVTGKTPLSSREDCFGGDIPFVTPTDFDSRRTIDSTDRRLTENGAGSVGGSRIPGRAVMVSCIGSDMGKAAIAGRDCVTNQQINSIIVTTDDDALFVYYNLSNRKTEIRTAAGGSAQPILNKSAFGQLDILLPPPIEQRAIAHILGTLDDKIELNRRMNETLEAMARALFKSWFVDFDPVRAKSEGRDPGLPKPLADLFPDSFEDSEMGEIPKGWKVGSVESLCDSITSGGTPARMNPLFWEGGSIPWFKTGELVDGPLIESEEHITQAALDGSSCKLWPAGTILFALYASPTVGRLGVLTRPGTSNQAAAGLIAKSTIGVPFLRRLLLDARLKLQAIAVGAAQQNINQAVLKAHRAVVPTEKVASEYSRLVSAADERQVALSKEAKALAALRDTLLPKLISGELRVSSCAHWQGVANS